MAKLGDKATEKAGTLGDLIKEVQKARNSTTFAEDVLDIKSDEEDSYVISGIFSSVVRKTGAEIKPIGIKADERLNHDGKLKLLKSFLKMMELL